MKNFSLSFLSEKDLFEFKDILKLYKSKHIFLKNKQYFDWRFKVSSKKYNIVILRYKKEIISFICYYTLAQYDKLIDNKIIFLSLLFSKKSVIPLQPKLLIDFIIKEKEPKLIFTSPIETCVNFNKRLGFEFKKINNYFFKIKKKNNIEGLKKFRKYSKIYKNNTHDCRIVLEKDFKNFDKKIFDHQYPFKSKTYLINKYIKHPVFKYNFLAYFKNKKIISLLILKIQKFKNSKIGRIVDFIGNQKNLYVFNNALYQLSKSKDLEYVDFYNFGIKEKNLIKAGFLNKKNFDSIIIPDYFKPYVNKNINQYMGAVYKDKMKFKKVSYYKGDCDLDTPV